MLNVAVLCSKRAPGLDALLACAEANVVAVITTDEGASIETAGVPLIVHHVTRERARRPIHDAALAALLTSLEVDLVICLGYLYVLTEPMLRAFPQRIVNIHDGDGRFPGLHATRDAIVANEAVTRSRLHIVDETLDGGPVLFVSKPYPVAPFVQDAVRAGETKIVKAYAYAHREWMIRDAWPPLLERLVASVGRQSRRRPLGALDTPAGLPAPHEAAS